MTNGSSQGLFVIVAVVIFGIFVSISYILFSGSLQPSLASIFNESIAQSRFSLTPFTMFNRISPSLSSDSKIRKEKDYYVVEVVSFDTSSSVIYPVGIRTQDLIEIPYNHKIILEYDVYFEGESPVMARFDFNSYIKDGNQTTNIGWQRDDNYGDTSNQKESKLVKPNTWTTVSGWYVNNHPKNVNQEPIFEGLNGKGSTGSTMGLRKDYLKEQNITSIKMKNIRYKVVPI